MRKLIVGLVVIVLLSAGFDVFLPPLLYTLTPLQRHYLGAYLKSSWKASDPAATTEVRWIWKFRFEIPATGKKPAKKSPPAIQYVLAREADVVSIPPTELLWKGGKLPFQMSLEAQQAGWAGVLWRTPVEVKSATLANLLREEIFAGEPAWRYFVQPAVLLISGVLLLWFLIRRRRSQQTLNLWPKPVPAWRQLNWNALRPRNALPVSLPRLALPVEVPARIIEADRIEPTVVVRSPVVEAPKATSLSAPPKFWDDSKGLE